jgi:hypothetical protein
MEGKIEVLTDASVGHRRCRRWPQDVKAQIAAEIRIGGATANVVWDAARSGVRMVSSATGGQACAACVAGTGACFCANDY